MGFAGGDDDAVIDGTQGHRILHGALQLEIDEIAMRDECPVFLNDIPGKTFLRNHGQGTPQKGACLIERDPDAMPGETRGGRNTGRTAANDGDPSRTGNGRCTGIRLAITIENGRLDARNVDGKIDVMTRARLHAEFVGTNESAGLPHGIRACDGFDGIAPAAGKGRLDEFLGVAVDRTGRHARTVTAIEAAMKLGVKLHASQIKRRFSWGRGHGKPPGSFLLARHARHS